MRGGGDEPSAKNAKDDMRKASDMIEFQRIGSFRRKSMLAQVNININRTSFHVALNCMYYDQIKIKFLHIKDLILQDQSYFFKSQSFI